MHQAIHWSIAALLAVGAVGQVSAQATESTAPATAQGEGAEALRAVIDKETGQLRAPTAAEAAAMQARAAAARAALANRSTQAAKPQAPAEVLFRAYPNGAKRARLTDEFHSHSVAVLRPDGTLDTQCYENHGAAMTALQKSRSDARQAAQRNEVE